MSQDKTTILDGLPTGHASSKMVLSEPYITDARLAALNRIAAALEHANKAALDSLNQKIIAAALEQANEAARPHLVGADFPGDGVNTVTGSIPKGGDTIDLKVKCSSPAKALDVFAGLMQHLQQAVDAEAAQKGGPQDGS